MLYDCTLMEKKNEKKKKTLKVSLNLAYYGSKDMMFLRVEERYSACSLSSAFTIFYKAHDMSCYLREWYVI